MTSIKTTPWDKAVLGIDTYELETISEDILKQVKAKQGHYTARVNPLDSAELLSQVGFYYCDTLLQPYCTKEMFVEHIDTKARACIAKDISPLLEICHGAFQYGRFHRDPNIHNSNADNRYDAWLCDLHKKNNVYELRYDDKTAGFIAVNENNLVLHALAEKYRGRGLAKYFWSALCSELFRGGHTELLSSISAANIAVLNLYISLGFRIKNATDVYHYLNQ